MTGINIGKAENEIPLKWRDLDAQGRPVTDIGVATAAVKASNRCTSGTAGDEIETYVAENQSALQNIGNGNYQLDWKTTKSWSNSCKELVFSIDGATDLAANTACSSSKRSLQEARRRAATEQPATSCRRSTVEAT